MLAIIDPGHGGSASGAISEDKTLYEKEVTLYVSLLVNDYLKYASIKNKIISLDDFCSADKQSVITTKLTRDTDKDVSLTERCKFANNAKADAFISIHCNAHMDRKAGGFEVWQYPSSKSFLGQYIHDACIEKIREFETNTNSSYKLKDRGIKRTENYTTLKKTSMPSVVVEIAFISNKEEEQLLRNNQFLDYVAKGIAIGIIKTLLSTTHRLKAVGL